MSTRAATARALSSAAVSAFHGFAGSLRVTGAIALAGALMAALLLPSRPEVTADTTTQEASTAGSIDELVA